MASDRGKGGSGKRIRWAVWRAVLLVALGVGAVIASRIWVRSSPEVHQRLDLLQDAWIEFNAKSYDRATAILDRRAAQVEPTPLDWMLRARIAESQGRLLEALDHLKKIPDSDPISSQAWLKAGQIELARHNARAAEAALHRSLALNSDQIQPYRELAYLYTVQRRREECDAQFRALAKRMPLDYVLAFGWCQNFCRIWDPSEGCRVLSRFLEFNPDDRISRIALAINLRVANRLDEARSTLAPLPDSDPEARALWAQFAMDAGEFDAAHALTRDGPADHVRLNVIRGLVALNSGDTRKSADYFRAALRRDPQDRDATHGLGFALRLLGDPQGKELTDTALRYDDLKRAIVLSVKTIDTDPRLFYKLGELCESIHRIDEARVWYQLAVKRDPLDPQAHQALARLDHTPSGQTALPFLK
jgi:tetratricopeptide (TPR) repeat protein